jgi:hypothetical protein
VKQALAQWKGSSILQPLSSVKEFSEKAIPAPPLMDDSAYHYEPASYGLVVGELASVTNCRCPHVAL